MTRHPIDKIVCAMYVASGVLIGLVVKDGWETHGWNLYKEKFQVSCNHLIVKPKPDAGREEYVVHVSRLIDSPTAVCADPQPPRRPASIQVWLVPDENIPEAPPAPAPDEEPAK